MVGLGHNIARIVNQYLLCDIISLGDVIVLLMGIYLKNFLKQK